MKAKGKSYTVLAPPPDRYFTEFVCIDRSTNRIYQGSNSQVREYSIGKLFKVKSDSAVGVGLGGLIALAGGTDSSRGLRNGFALIDLPRRTLSVKKPLPVGVKHGNFHEHDEWIYFVGGVTETTQENDDSLFISAPIMRYSVTDNFWEVFSYEAASKQGLMYAHSELNSSTLSATTQLDLRKLIHYGSFMVGNKIYLIGGLFQRHSGEWVPNKTVYSIEVGSSQLTVKREETEFPYEVVAPVCCSLDDKGIVAGGYSPGDSSVLTVCCMSISPTISYSLLEPLPVHLPDCHPAVFSQKRLIYTNFPYLMQYTLVKRTWETLDIHLLKHSETEIPLECGEDDSSLPNVTLIQSIILPSDTDEQFPAQNVLTPNSSLSFSSTITFGNSQSCFFNTDHWTYNVSSSEGPHTLGNWSSKEAPSLHSSGSEHLPSIPAAYLTDHALSSI